MTQRKNETKEEYLARCRQWRLDHLEQERKRHYKKFLANRGDYRNFCCEDISLIENYEEAKADNFVGWDLHHRLEIGAFYTLSVAELKALNLYNHRPASELIYLRHGEHTSLHLRFRNKSHKSTN